MSIDEDSLYPNSPEMPSGFHGSQDHWKTPSHSSSEDTNEL